MLLNKACRRNVRHDHALFDQFVRVITYRWLHALNTAFGVEDKLGFFGFEGDTTALGTSLIQHFIQRMQLLQVFDQRMILLAQFLIALQDMPDLGVG
ncbi:hypothetical protein D3C80_1454370 [compost metagenome]